MKTGKTAFQILSLGLIFLSHLLTAHGAVANVIVSPGGALSFSPATTNIAVNDSVIWTWSGSGHSTTSSGASAGLWDSGVVNAPFSFTNTFGTPGTFTYVCTPHASFGMVGSVVVAIPPPPTANVMVGSGGFTFSPATVSMPTNSRVIWTWAGPNHSTTSGTVGSSSVTPNGLWDSGVKSSSFSFTNTFSTPGTFSYYCTPHAISFGMKATVIITNAVAPNVPPIVTITNPVSSVTLSAPASLVLKANATDSDGTIASVQFLQGTTSLGSVTTAPFSLAVNNLAAATYTFSAIATDNGGATATNAITVKVINANPVAIGSTSFISANHFKFSYSSDIGLTYLVLVSSNLFNWTPINTNTATVNPTIFTDPNANNAGSFYRVGRLPNP